MGELLKDHLHLVYASAFHATAPFQFCTCFHQSTLIPLFFPSHPVFCIPLLILTCCDCFSLLSQFFPVIVEPLPNVIMLDFQRLSWDCLCQYLTTDVDRSPESLLNQIKHQSLLIEEDCPTLIEEVHSFGMPLAM